MRDFGKARDLRQPDAVDTVPFMKIGAGTVHHHEVALDQIGDQGLRIENAEQKTQLHEHDDDRDGYAQERNQKTRPPESKQAKAKSQASDHRQSSDHR